MPLLLSVALHCFGCCIDSSTKNDVLTITLFAVCWRQFKICDYAQVWNVPNVDVLAWNNAINNALIINKQPRIVSMITVSRSKLLVLNKTNRFGNWQFMKHQEAYFCLSSPCCDIMTPNTHDWTTNVRYFKYIHWSLTFRCCLFLWVYPAHYRALKALRDLYTFVSRFCPQAKLTNTFSRQSRQRMVFTCRIFFFLMCSFFVQLRYKKPDQKRTTSETNAHPYS